MASEYYDLGSHHWPVTTSSPEAQVWFDRGMGWVWGFNPEAATACFRRVVELDPSCAMGHWGIAYVLGPTYNHRWDQFSPVELKRAVAAAHAAVVEANRLAADASPLERAVVKALKSRYPEPVPSDDLIGWSVAYSDAMREVWRDYRDNMDIVGLFAESLMVIRPRELWDQQANEPIEGAPTLEILDVLEEALRTPEGREHPAVLHLYIHLLEVSPYIERTVPSADRLRTLAPDAGHLLHMPTHIDAMVGDYVNLVNSNLAAVAADRKYTEREGGMNFYTLSRVHNLHFVVYGAMMLGQETLALEAAEELAAACSDELLRVEVPPMAYWLEGNLPMKLHALIRFGRWNEIIETPLPSDPELYQVTTAVTHYAQGIAYAALGRVEEAEESRRAFQAAAAKVGPERNVWGVPCQDLLAVSAEMLNGEIEYRKGNYDEAFAHLRQSVALDDDLPQKEPWGQTQPPRHALGALLLEQNRIEEAETVYREDLGYDDRVLRVNQRPNNVWSLHGYHECLTRLGKTEIASIIKRQLDFAASRADVPIEASCCCRTEMYPVGDACCHHEKAAD
ncbi:MAG TPA: hypothetical protein VKU87_12710 [Thermomicrobiaceae bacterium]|nr:hypothetical protein [Thermomicrobiaceae bacterium]